MQTELAITGIIMLGIILMAIAWKLAKILQKQIDEDEK